MNLRTLIDAPALAERMLGPTPPVLLDCRFDLVDTAAGEREYALGHLPGARYVHLDRDLSGPKLGPDGGFRGRHPLPERDTWAVTVGRLGIGPSTTVVAYDAQGGPYAARAWWMLRWLGHEAVAVLDGGIDAWTATGGALESTAPVIVPQPAYPAREPAPMPLIDAGTLAGRLGRVCLLDARAGERFRGEVEPLDAAAGHIPGALNRFFKDNLQPDGHFKSAARLRAELAPLVAGHDADRVVHQCGSGVTACHNLLALEHAGLGTTVLYPGSWSEWSADPQRPIAVG